MAEPPRLRDEAVAERLARLDDLLAEVEAMPGPAGDTALTAVSELTRVYGEALARATGYAAEAAGVIEGFVRDELIGHLLVLHDIHPEPVGRRVARAVDAVRTAVAGNGGGVELTGIDGGVATVTLSGGGCGSTVSGITELVREAVLAVAPELSDVKVLAPGGKRDTAFVPLASVTARGGARP
jgi:Fe-S cluster biogenesis protein NfuA